MICQPPQLPPISSLDVSYLSVLAIIPPMPSLQMLSARGNANLSWMVA